MPAIGVRELKTRASKIIRELRDRRARYVVTYRGRPVGLLLPLDAGPGAGPDQASESAWDELVRLGQEIGEGWQSPLTGTELISDMRR